MGNFTVDEEPVIAEVDKVGGPNVLLKHFGLLGGAVAIEIVALLEVPGAGAAITSVDVPVDFQITFSPPTNVLQLDENAEYTAVIRDPDVSNGAWTTVNQVALDLQA
jgi:hypothetical protein